MSTKTTAKETERERQVQALKAAQECARLLKEQFGARRVILFGSLAGQGPWHEGSDIDLAVEGIPPEDFFRAYAACGDLLPPGIELDLIPLEDAYPEMRARILGEVEMPEDPVEALKSLVEDELTALGRVVQENEELLAECAHPPTRVELRAMATLLHEFYTGIESIFERIAVWLGEGRPRGEFWHTDLLNRMAETREGIRPAVIDEPLRARLEEYLKFRHFFRHAYGYTLEWHRMRWKVEYMAETLEMLRQQLTAFFEKLVEERSASS